MFWTILGLAFVIWLLLVILFTPRIDYRVTSPIRPDSDEFRHVIQSTCQAPVHIGNRVDILTDPFPFDGLFDVILLTEVIEHIHPLQLAEFAGSLAGRLAAGGTLIATTPNLTSFSSRLKMAFGLKPNFFTLDPTHITPFRPADLDGLWTAAGLTTLSVRTTRAMMPVLRGWDVALPFRWNLGDHIVGVWRKA